MFEEIYYILLYKQKYLYTLFVCWFRKYNPKAKTEIMISMRKHIQRYYWFVLALLFRKATQSYRLPQ